MNKNQEQAKQSLDKIIQKGRVHLYKPIQIAEILYRARTTGDVNLLDLESYRTRSRAWRDEICIEFVGRTSSSSARYQDDVFNDNAVPPRYLNELGKINEALGGIVEAYIYRRFAERFTQVTSGHEYLSSKDKTTFDLKEFLDLFWNEPGLRRSIDKIYEMVVFSLFASLVDAIEITVEIKYNKEKYEILKEFEDFTNKVLMLGTGKSSVVLPGQIYRNGITNAADRGLDMWANFGLAIQIKHLSLTEELAQNIVSSVSADRIVIVCKDSEKKIILSLLTQIGWKARIQSIITETDLTVWYQKALRGKFSSKIGENIISLLREQISLEFPATNNKDFEKFLTNRGYKNKINSIWN